MLEEKREMVQKVRKAIPALKSSSQENQILFNGNYCYEFQETLSHPSTEATEQ